MAPRTLTLNLIPTLPLPPNPTPNPNPNPIPKPIPNLTSRDFHHAENPMARATYYPLSATLNILSTATLSTATLTTATLTTATLTVPLLTMAALL